MAPLHLGSTVNALRVTSRRTLPQLQPQRGFVAATRLRSQGYGDGKGDPKAEKPQEQPAASKAQTESEHPGPEAPDVGLGKGSPGTKSAMSDSMNKAAGEMEPEEKASAQSGGSRSKEAAETGSSPTGGEIKNVNQSGGDGLKGPQGEGTPQPKVHNQSISMPGVVSGLTDEQKAEVEQHNKEFDERHDRAGNAPKDQVDKKFWKGSTGRDGTETDWSA